MITGTTGANREELYNWLLNQLKNRDGGHALSLDTFKHLLIEKVRFTRPVILTHLYTFSFSHSNRSMSAASS